jgi:hypothetical protein
MDELKPLKKNDEVLVKSLNRYGKVVHVVPGDESEAERAYRVQITSFFRRFDLELYDPIAEREKDEKAAQERITRMETALSNWRLFIASYGDANSKEASQLGLEVLKATDAVARIFGRSLLKDEGE